MPRGESAVSLVYLNGSYVPADEARVPVTDRGLAYGDGVFTTIRVSGGKPHFFEWHLERLLRDAAALYIESPPIEDLADACHGLLSRLEVDEGALKISVTRGAGRRGPSPKNAGKPTVIVTTSSLPEQRQPLRTITVPDDRGPLAAHKTLNYLPNVLALYQAEAAGCDEALFSRHGLLVEATVSNLVGVVNGVPLTPSLDGTVLDGIARRALLEAGAVQEGELPSNFVGPLYCVNNVRGVEVVAEMDGRRMDRDPELHEQLKGALDHQARRTIVD
jgi:branched-subunit amino acid aminotransferase/4-amino-4-deoxychorismate lyase